MVTDMQNEQSISKPTLMQRLFPGGLPPSPDYDAENGEKCIVTKVISVLDWKDRLRLLISGKTSVNVTVVIDDSGEPLKSASRFHVLPPGYNVPTDVAHD